jgi:hypothetical protein
MHKKESNGEQDSGGQIEITTPKECNHNNQEKQKNQATMEFVTTIQQPQPRHNMVPPNRLM